MVTRCHPWLAAVPCHSGWQYGVVGKRRLCSGLRAVLALFLAPPARHNLACLRLIMIMIGFHDYDSFEVIMNIE